MASFPSTNRKSRATVRPGKRKLITTPYLIGRSEVETVIDEADGA